MAAIAERVEDEADETASQPSAAPVVLDDAMLERLVGVLRPGASQPARPAWAAAVGSTPSTVASELASREIEPRL